MRDDWHLKYHFFGRVEAAIAVEACLLCLCFGLDWQEKMERRRLICCKIVICDGREKVGLQMCKKQDAPFLFAPDIRCDRLDHKLLERIF